MRETLLSAVLVSVLGQGLGFGKTLVAVGLSYSCPKCRTPIAHCIPYQRQIVHKAVERVKRAPKKRSRITSRCGC